MAKSQNYVFTGKAYWTRLFEGQEDTYGDDEKSFYKITVELDEDSVIKYKSSGLKLKFHDVSKDNNAQSITFRRDKEPRVFADGSALGGGTPKVVDAEGKAWDTSKAIGNESVVQVLVQKYVPKSKPSMVGHRLEAVKILKHVPYEPLAFEDSPSFDDTENEDTLTTPKKSSKTVSVGLSQDMSDSIPF